MRSRGLKKKVNTLTFHSLSMRDNLRVFIVTERLHVEWRSDGDAARDSE